MISCWTSGPPYLISSLVMSLMLGAFLVLDLSIACFTSSMVIFGSSSFFPGVSVLLFSSFRSCVLYRSLKCFSHVSLATL